MLIFLFSSLFLLLFFTPIALFLIWRIAILMYKTQEIDRVLKNKTGHLDTISGRYLWIRLNWFLYGQIEWNTWFSTELVFHVYGNAGATSDTD